MRSYETALKRRRRGVAIHLAVNPGMPDDLRALVVDEIDVDDQTVPGDEVTVQHGMLGAADLKQMITDDRPDLLFPAIHAAVSGADPRLCRRLLRRHPG